MVNNIQESFAQYENDFIRFERIVSPPSQRRDLCAFLLLEKLVPSDVRIVAAAEHDQIYLEVSPDALADVATLDDILYLVRCGVLCNDEGLYMFV